ncbi:carbohydrate-binding module family 20 domain-containing protein [[Micrococcus luteus] ATCC 49442]|uniref:carbohydrate-binding module family 20 domain-containing protein n=1 Tax=[Micrococcus luteus] ATCC 49442 TaxID=2698727 RepID=UPI0013D9A56A|nr:carbohydrate-binding module family 20 domain-containing protein [[Micrococcus luteus] ATCC 49442]
MPTSWPNLLFRLLGAGVASAAGAAASLAAGGPASPLAGPAEAAAKQAAEQLLKQFLPAQQEATQKVELLARDIQSLAGGIDTRVRFLQEGPARAARLHMEDAALHPERAAEELQAARQLLYEAWGAASGPGQRSLAAQELSGVYAFLGQRDDAVRWIERSLPDSDLAVSEAIEAFRVSLNQFPDKIPRRADAGDFVGIDLRLKRVFAPVEKIVPVVQRLVEARYDALDLRKRSIPLGAGTPWPAAPSRVELGRSGELLFSTPGGGAAVDLDHPDPAMSLGARTMLRSLKTLHFSIADGPWVNRPGRTYVVGSSPQLGGWEPASGIQLTPRPRSESTISSTVWTLKRKTMEAVIQVLDEENVEARYFFIPDQEGSIVWEPCTRRISAQMPASFYRQSDMFRPGPDVWGIP